MLDLKKKNIERGYLYTIIVTVYNDKSYTKLLQGSSLYDFWKQNVH